MINKMVNSHNTMFTLENSAKARRIIAVTRSENVGADGSDQKVKIIATAAWIAKLYKNMR